MLTVEPHPLLEIGAFITRFSTPIGAAPEWLRASAPLLSASEASRSEGAVLPRMPVQVDDSVRAAIRDMLRAHGYKPTGRGKPASEYLARGELPIINMAVDCGNFVSLHSGLPISVVDLDRTKAPLKIAVGAAGESYVFNQGGQVIDVEGIPCLFDAEGPCANAVKDAQRTKTSSDSRTTLSIVWGSRALGDRTLRTVAWYRELLARADVHTEMV
jgi:DNA/RNA-binding domain of Phe-tRNA-synthetase-like protein